MKLLLWIMTALAAVAVVAALIAGRALDIAPSVLLDSTPLTALVDVLLVLLLLAALLQRNAPDFRRMVAWIAPILGVLIFAFEVLAIRSSMERVHVTRFIVIAPSVAQALLPVFLGFLAAAVALTVGPRRPLAA